MQSTVVRDIIIIARKGKTSDAGRMNERQNGWTDGRTNERDVLFVLFLGQFERCSWNNIYTLNYLF